MLDGREPRPPLEVDHQQRPACLIADNYAVEADLCSSGARCCVTLPLHEHCLFKLGVNLGEPSVLTPLADWLRANGRYRFLLTAPPLRLHRRGRIAGDAGRDGVRAALGAGDMSGRRRLGVNSLRSPAPLSGAMMRPGRKRDMQIDQAFSELNLVQDFVPAGNFNCPGTRLVPQFITIHKHGQ